LCYEALARTGPWGAFTLGVKDSIVESSSNTILAI
jgi:hypothetical protein